MNENLIHWANESQLLGHGESDSTGAWIKFRVEPEDLDHFRGLKGVVFYLIVVQLDGEGKPIERAVQVADGARPAVTVAENSFSIKTSEQGTDIPIVAAKLEHPYGKQAAELYRNGFFLVPVVLRAIGTDEEFLEWVKQHPCCAASAISQCEGDVVAAHVRRVANGAGTGIKPEYSAVPLCNLHHSLQHQKGESALGGKDWFDAQRVRFVQKWAAHKLAGHFAEGSIGDVEPCMVRAWAEATVVTAWLPTVYRNA